MLNPRKIPGGNELMDAMQTLRKAGLEEGMKVADFGCGRQGYFILQAAKMVGRNGVAYAVDILKEVLENVEDLAKDEGIYNIKTVWSNLEIFGATKIENNSLDFGFIINVLFQVENRLALIKEVARMLKPDGKLLVIDWHKTQAPFGPTLGMRVSTDEIKENAKELGLKLVDEFDAGKYHFGLIFKKL
ncbi:MAG: methyltransferase domain-containing protein [Patescibacteria group bacterium]